jgi:hypothetical protein
LALKYIHTQRGTSLRSFQTALAILDQIAELKGTDALVCEAANLRLNERFMRRYGWEQHTASPRNYIKRFYGNYEDRNRSADPSQLATVQSYENARLFESPLNK